MKRLMAFFKRFPQPTTIAPNRQLHREDSSNDFNIRIVKANNGYIVHGMQHDNNGNMKKDEMHIVTPDENLIDAVAKVLVAMQMG